GRRAQSANLSERFSFDKHFCDLLELSSQCDDSAERFPAQFFFAELQCIENNILPGILEPCEFYLLFPAFPSAGIMHGRSLQRCSCRPRLDFLLFPTIGRMIEAPHAYDHWPDW